MVLGFDRLDLIAPPIAAGTNLVSPCIYCIAYHYVLQARDLLPRSLYQRNIATITMHLATVCNGHRYRPNHAGASASTKYQYFLEKRLNIE